MTIRRSSLAVSGSSCSSSDGKSSGCRPIQAPTYRLGGSVTLAPIWEERQTRNKAAVQSRQVRIRYNNLSSCHHISKNNANMYRSFLNHSAPLSFARGSEVIKEQIELLMYGAENPWALKW